MSTHVDVQALRDQITWMRMLSDTEHEPADARDAYRRVAVDLDAIIAAAERVQPEAVAAASDGKWVMPVEQEAVAWRYRNWLGEVVSEWIDGQPPEKLFDLCGNEIVGCTIESAYPPPQACRRCAG